MRPPDLVCTEPPHPRSVAWGKLGAARTVPKLREGLALLARLARHPAFLYANPAEKACGYVCSNSKSERILFQTSNCFLKTFF